MRNVIRLLCSLFLLLALGCGSVERNGYGFISSDRMEERLRIDSIVLHDSIFIREKSDTVFFTKYRTLYKERILCDSVLRCDTVYVEREVCRERGGGFPFMLVVAVLLLFLLWRIGFFDLLRFLFKK